MLQSNWTRAPQLLSLQLQLLSPCATTTEARVPRAHAPQREATAMRSPRTATKSSPHSPQLEKAHAQQQRPNVAKNKFIGKKKDFQKNKISGTDGEAGPLS